MYRLRHLQKDTSNSTGWHNPSVLYYMLSSECSRCCLAHCPAHCEVNFRSHSILLLAHLTVPSQVYCTGTPMNTTKYVPTHTTESLSSTIPSTPWCALPAALDGILPAPLALKIPPVQQWISPDRNHSVKFRTSPTYLLTRIEPIPDADRLDYPWAGSILPGAQGYGKFSWSLLFSWGKYIFLESKI
jgi:hypothetical protein